MTQYLAAQPETSPLSVLLSTCHVNDSTPTRTASGCFPLLVRPPGTVFRTLFPIRTAFRCLLKTFLVFLLYWRTKRNKAVGSPMMCYTNWHIDNEIDIRIRAERLADIVKFECH